MDINRRNWEGWPGKYGVPEFQGRECFKKGKKVTHILLRSCALLTVHPLGKLTWR